MTRLALLLMTLVASAPSAHAQQWVASWTAAQQGANDQTFRLIVRPDVWGPQARIRLSNVLGARPVIFDSAFVDLQESGPLTWHAKALQTSCISAPGSGAKGREDGEASFPFTTTSWFFLDEVDRQVASVTRVVGCVGDSITDGTGTTIDGDDRWPDGLSRRPHAAFNDSLVVVNQGLGDCGPATLVSATGEIKAIYQPSSSTGGPGDKLHPDRAGYATMANAIDRAAVAARIAPIQRK